MADLKALKTQIRTGKQVVAMNPDTMDILKKFDGGLGGFLEKFAKEMSAQIAQKLLQNEDVMFELAMITARHVMANKDLKGMPGDNGKTPEEAYLIELIKPLIPAPVKGNDGYTPVKGRDYFDGKPGKNGENFFTPEQEAQFLRIIVGDVLKDVKSDGKSMVSAINNLDVTPELQIDAKHIKNLPKQVGATSTPLHRGGIKLIWNTELDGIINGVNTIFTVPTSLPDPKDDKYIVEARGTVKSVTSGDFAISNSNRTVTFTVAPPTGSARPRIVLYHGK